MQTESKMQTADCRPGVKVKIPGARVKINSNDKIRITDKDLKSVRSNTRIFFSKIPKTQTKKLFLALVKRYIMNLEFLNSTFNLLNQVSHKGAGPCKLIAIG